MITRWPSLAARAERLVWGCMVGAGLRGWSGGGAVGAGAARLERGRRGSGGASQGGTRDLDDGPEILPLTRSVRADAEPSERDQRVVSSDIPCERLRREVRAAVVMESDLRLRIGKVQNCHQLAVHEYRMLKNRFRQASGHKREPEVGLGWRVGTHTDKLRGAAEILEARRKDAPIVFRQPARSAAFDVDRQLVDESDEFLERAKRFRSVLESGAWAADKEISEHDCTP